METQELRYFVTVAEELHFGRAARRLAIAQPPLSRAIQQLERRLGVPLLHRGARAVSLTAAGQVLLPEARAILDAVESAGRRTRRAGAKGPDILLLAAKAGAAGELLPRLLDAYAAQSGTVVEVVLVGPGEPERLLRDGSVDVALLQRPYDSATGFDTEDLYTEQQVLVLPARHELADRPHLLAAEVNVLIDLPQPRWPLPDGGYDVGPGPRIRDHTQLLQLIALGKAYALVPESVRPLLRDEHAVVPVLDAPTVTTVIAWPLQSRSRSVADFVRVATQLSPTTSSR